VETTETPEMEVPQRMKPRRFMSFALFIWAFVTAAFVVAIVWPLISGEIVLKSWKQIPCRVSPHGDMYFYSFMNQKYYSERLDLWDRFHIESHTVPNDEIASANNGNCYVNPNNPLQSVLYPNALERISGAGSRAASWAFLAVAAIIMTFRVRRQAKKRTGEGRA
jgi:hypothetical protein